MEKERFLIFHRERERENVPHVLLIHTEHTSHLCTDTTTIHQSNIIIVIITKPTHIVTEDAVRESRRVRKNRGGSSGENDC